MDIEYKSKIPTQGLVYDKTPAARHGHNMEVGCMIQLEFKDFD